MSTDDGQFIATGGGDIDDGNPIFGFYTDPSKDDDGAQMDYGVNVQGQVCGVYAESLGTPQLMADRKPRLLQSYGQHVGVYSIGQSYGVIAECFTGNGVTGISPYESGAGVQGTSTSDQIGVLGLSMHGNMLKTGNGAGVQGVSGTGVGVRGVSRREIDPDTPLKTSDLEPNRETDDILSKGIGVEGVSGAGVGVHGQSISSSGIHGESRTGPGVTGHSGSGRGGVFSSTDIAQLQLTPVPAHDLRPADLRPAPLPADGMPGDFFVRNLPETVPTPDGHARIRLRAELWFCVLSASGSTPAEWKQIA